MSVKLHQHFGWHESDLQKGEIGLEIETESKNDYAIDPIVNAYWQVHTDGSLRWYGKEFVFRQAYNYKSNSFNEALRVFDELTKTIKFEKSVYSSVHVHLNMLHRRPIHVMNFIALYFLFEEVLTDYCGSDRNGNLFCLKTSNAEYTCEQACKMAEAFEKSNGYTNFLHRLNNNYLKYSGLNLAALRSLGTLEIRTHGGTTNIEEITRWVDILYILYEKSCEFASPKDILRKFQSTTPEVFFRVFWGRYSEVLKESVFVKTLRNPLWYLGNLAAATKWGPEYGENISKNTSLNKYGKPIIPSKKKKIFLTAPPYTNDDLPEELIHDYNATTMMYVNEIHEGSTFVLEEDV